MADRVCNYCEDRGDCDRCSRFFQPDSLHSKCGKPWRDHVHHAQPESNGGIYPGWNTCPADEVPVGPCEAPLLGSGRERRMNEETRAWA